MNTVEQIKAIKEEHGSPFENCNECTYGTHNNEVIEKLHRLAELEDKLESGLLVGLPCKRGDTIYWVDNFGFGYDIREEIVKSISVEADGIKVYVSDGYFWKFRFGVCCFTDKAEAEAKLKELQEGQK